MIYDSFTLRIRQFGERNNAEKFNRYEQSKCDSLKENQIGITEYVSPGPGFTGIIKHRISDFQVNEIDLDGNVAKLTDTKAPKPPKGISFLTEIQTINLLIYYLNVFFFCRGRFKYRSG